MDGLFEGFWEIFIGTVRMWNFGSFCGAWNEDLEELSIHNHILKQRSLGILILESENPRNCFGLTFGVTLLGGIKLLRYPVSWDHRAVHENPWYKHACMVFFYSQDSLVVVEFVSPQKVEEEISLQWSFLRLVEICVVIHGRPLKRIEP